MGPTSRTFVEPNDTAIGSIHPRYKPYPVAVQRRVLDMAMTKYVGLFLCPNRSPRILFCIQPSYTANGPQPYLISMSGDVTDIFIPPYSSGPREVKLLP